MPFDPCIFCKIIKNQLPAYKILETKDVIGILDNTPIAQGHCLIIPKIHVNYWYELKKTQITTVFNAAKLIAKQIKKQYHPDYICMFIRGGRVKHTHIVLFPSYEQDKLSGFPQSAVGKQNINFKEVQEKLEIKNSKKERPIT